MRRVWSIRARTAVVFAVAAMALATAVVVFSNLMSQAGIDYALSTSPAADPGVEPPFAVATSDPTLAPEAIAGERAGISVIRVVAVQQWQWSAIGIAGAGLVAGGVGWLLSRRMLRPIDRITATANRITASRLHERIGLEGPDDELRRLSTTIDDLLDRLQSAFESQRRFVAQASHELRTPLAVQRAAMQIGLHDGAGPEEVRTTRDELLQQNRRTEHLVESLLVLAEADRGLELSEDVDLGAVIAESVSGVTDRARAARVTLSYTDHRSRRNSCPVVGEAVLVGQMLSNLIGNAVEYNEPGGFVDVTITDEGLAVENSGPIVPADVAPQLVEPFLRWPRENETGRHSGLGLSIVASIAAAHAWPLTISARATGGLRVHVGAATGPRSDLGGLGS